MVCFKQLPILLRKIFIEYFLSSSLLSLKISELVEDPDLHEAADEGLPLAKVDGGVDGRDHLLILLEAGGHALPVAVGQVAPALGLDQLQPAPNDGPQKGPSWVRSGQVRGLVLVVDRGVSQVAKHEVEPGPGGL